MLSGLFSFLKPRHLAVVLLLGVNLLSTEHAAAQVTIVQAASPQTEPANKDGIWFQVKAAIKPRPGDQDADKSEPRASLSVKLRISSHAEGSRFFGQPMQRFDFKLADGAGEKLFWQDGVCHPRRGLPKISVVAIDGSIDRDGKTTEIKARPRHLGVKLPEDEISPGSSFVRTSDKDLSAMVFGARTSASKVEVVVKIYTVDCALTTAAR